MITRFYKMGLEDVCNTGLSLSLGSLDHRPENHLLHHQNKKKSSLKSDDHPLLFPSLALGLSSNETYRTALKIDVSKVHGEATTVLQRQASLLSAVSSYSNSSMKKERVDLSGEEIEMEVEKVSSKLSDDHDHDHDQEYEEGSARKKLRLTKEQSLVLEDNFKEHSTLNPKQKQTLAEQLNLRPRQVEVWFQNRRARTKMKQTEVDCEVLKKCCEALRDENRRLQKELHELKALKPMASCYMQLPAATLTVCPSCERIGGSGSGESTSKKPFPIRTRPQFYNSFSHPSAAF
ncbi:homeobox-leucine zipper protein HAT22-like [Cornus florida]|uniref:homeobox-leucine zipper protein HAT22-like n=1 Tax=Cornus florida TaxID=4283 RepID=UPI0028A01179|nr:homeobox-leucine zipper protein HAT22-like [Cornus florida]